MDDNPPTSSYPFDYDSISLDDELMQLISNAFPQTPQNYDVSALLTTSTENQAQYSHNNLLTFSNSFHASTQLPQHNNVVEFNFASTPAPTPAQAPAPAPAPSKDEAGKKKAKAVEIERKRRHDMSSLYQELRSLLPPALIKKKRSISDLLQVTTNHINSMEEGIKALNDKRDELLKMTSGAGSSSSSSTSKQQQSHHVTVKPCKDGLIEVIVRTSALDDDDHENNRGFRLSKMLCVLGEEGLNVINCVSSRIGSNLVHTIQAQVDDGRGFDLCLLRQTLTDHS